MAVNECKYFIGGVKYVKKVKSYFCLIHLFCNQITFSSSFGGRISSCPISKNRFYNFVSSLKRQFEVGPSLIAFFAIRLFCFEITFDNCGPQGIRKALFRILASPFLKINRINNYHEKGKTYLGRCLARDSYLISNFRP